MHYGFGPDALLLNRSDSWEIRAWGSALILKDLKEKARFSKSMINLQD